MEECKHDGGLVEGYYGHDCALCGVLIYPYGQEPWNVPTEEQQRIIDEEEYRRTHWTCETCGGEFGDGWTTCTCEVEDGGD